MQNRVFLAQGGALLSAQRAFRATIGRAERTVVLLAFALPILGQTAVYPFPNPAPTTYASFSPTYTASANTAGCTNPSEDQSTTTSGTGAQVIYPPFFFANLFPVGEQPVPLTYSSPPSPTQNYVTLVSGVSQGQNASATGTAGDMNGGFLTTATYALTVRGSTVSETYVENDQGVFTTSPGSSVTEIYVFTSTSTYNVITGFQTFTFNETRNEGGINYPDTGCSYTNSYTVTGSGTVSYFSSGNPPPPGSGTGIDLSQVPSHWTPLTTMLTDVGNDPTDAVGNPVGPPQFVIADAWGGTSDFPAIAILSGAPPGLLKAAYAIISYGNPSLTGAMQISRALLNVGAQEQANLGFMAVDVESNTLPTDSQSIANRNNTIAQAIQAVQDAGLKPVVYTNTTYWNNITGGTTSFGCIPLWRVQLPYDDVAEVNFTSGFGGWTQAVGKQYQAVQDGSAEELVASGVSAVDLDVFTDLSIFTPGTSCTANPQGCMAEDVTSSVSISRRDFHYNVGTQSFDQILKIVNTSATSLAGPLSLVFDNLNNAVIANETAYSEFGVTSCTYPRLSIFVNVLSGALAPGQSVAVPIQFRLTGNAGITYTTRLLSGNGTR